MKIQVDRHAVAAVSLLVPTAAQAHISLHPNTIPAGAFATLDVRVPGEQEGAHVTKVDVLFPAGFTGVDYENVPGWSTRIIETKLATPLKEDGETIDTRSPRSFGRGPARSARSTTVSSSTSRCRWRSRLRDWEGARIQDGPELQQRPGLIGSPVADGRTPLAEDQRHGQRRRDPRTSPV